MKFEDKIVILNLSRVDSNTFAFPSSFEHPEILLAFRNEYLCGTLRFSALAAFRRRLIALFRFPVVVDARGEIACVQIAENQPCFCKGDGVGVVPAG